MKAQILIFLISVNLIYSQTPTKLLGSFKTENPAFFAQDNNKQLSDSNDIVISSFSGIPWTSGKIWILENLQSQMLGDISQIQTRQLADGFAWPNVISIIPKDYFGQKAILIPDGFLPPGKSNGGLKIMTLTDDLQKDKVYTISAQKDTFHHVGLWVDLNGDQLPDLITARTIESGLFSKSFKGELIWLENPGFLSENQWKEHKIADGPDVMINIIELDNNPQTIEILAAEFFVGKKIQLIQLDKSTGNVIFQRTIDDKTAGAYNVFPLDVNNDGQIELVASNHDSHVDVAEIWCYQIPSDIKNGKFNKISLAKNFVTKFSILPGAASPGFVYPVYPQISQTGKERPHLLVAGDGSDSVYLLTPQSKDGFDYQMVTLKDLGGTVGSLLIGDFNKDGYSDFLVPNYDSNYVEVYTFAQ